MTSFLGGFRGSANIDVILNKKEDQIILALLTKNSALAIRTVSEVFDWWYRAHFTEFLYQADNSIEYTIL